MTKYIYGEETDIDIKFKDVIRNKMTDDQFWEWIRGWKDPEDLVEQAEEWDTETKRKELKEFKKMGLLKEVV